MEAARLMFPVCQNRCDKVGLTSTAVCVFSFTISWDRLQREQPEPPLNYYDYGYIFHLTPGIGLPFRSLSFPTSRCGSSSR